MYSFHGVIAQIEHALQIDQNGPPFNLFTLKKAFLFLQSPFLKLKTIHQLIQQICDQKGGRLLSILYDLCEHGDRGISSFLLNIHKSASVPYLKMIKKWMFDGELDDIFSEFFIAAEMAETENLWKSKFSLRHDMLPSFISKDLAKKIFLGGKTVFFLRSLCGITIDQLKSEQDFTHWDDGMQEAILHQFAYINGIMMNVLFEKYHLKDHFVALKNFLLLGQGDFIQSLITELE
jgi:gamma-tubulin complex component 3